MNGYTGKLLEEEILGCCLWVWDGYLSFRESVKKVKAFQPWDPTDPRPRAANDFHFFVSEALEVECSELGFFTSVGTPLDRYHGVDAFFEYNGRVATVDLTSNGKKDEYKADLIVHEEDIYQEDGNVNQERLQELASLVAGLLKKEPRRLVAQRESQ